MDFCDGKLHPPFLYWSNKLTICGRCCQGIKRGLTADLIHLAAIMDLRDLRYYETLDRTGIAKLKQDWSERKEAVDAIRAGKLKPCP